MKLHTLVLLAALACVPGCSSSKGEALMSYDHGKPAFMMHAPDDGEYLLYLKSDPEAQPQRFKLKQGDLLGFEKTTANEVYAVAGSQKVKIQDQNYVWRRK